MPIYDYRCDHCGHVFSAVRSYADEAVRECPSCGRLPRKLMAQPAIVFKGSGWYKTDSRAPAKKAEDKDKKGAAETKTEATKPDAPKADAKDATPPAKEAAS